MQDNNLPNSQVNDPSHVDDYQPPQVTSSSSDDKPFSVPAAPVVNAGDDQIEEKTSDPLDALNQIILDVDKEKKERKSIQSLSFNDELPYVEEKLEEPIIADKVKSQSQSLDDLNQIISDIDADKKERESQRDSSLEDISFDSEGAAPALIQSEPSENKVPESPLSNQSLETQNIFDLLGVSDGKDEEKEAFLDELQEVIWEDFVENDVKMLLSEEQLAKLNEIQKKGQTREVQEEMLVYLEELLPDLEDIMMDKALELKEDMVLERISGMKEFYSGNQVALDQVAEAERLISENKWADAGSVLNSIK
jgi:hypothetical protein